LKFISPMSHYTSSIWNVFVRRTARLLKIIKDHAFSLYVTITFGLAMREFLFNEKKKIIGKGMIWGGGGKGREKSERSGKMRRSASELVELRLLVRIGLKTMKQGY